MTLVSSANSMGSEIVLVFNGKQFIYIMKSSGPKTDP
jgi:hypothetical protein